MTLCWKEIISKNCNRIFQRLIIFERTIFFKKVFFSSELEEFLSLQDISFEAIYSSYMMGDKDQKANFRKACKPFTIVHEQFITKQAGYFFARTKTHNN